MSSLKQLDYTLSQHRENESFLRYLPSLQPQNEHPSSSSPQSGKSAVTAIFAPPKLPTLAIEHNFAMLDSSSIPGTGEKSKELVAGMVNVADRGLAVTDDIHRRRETVVVDTGNVGAGMNHIEHPLRLTLLGYTTSSYLRVAPMVLAPAILGSVTITLPSPPTWFSGKLGQGFSTLVPATVRQLVTPTAIPHITSAPPHSLPGFVFDPGGFHSAVRHLLHLRSFSCFAAFDFSPAISASLFVVTIKGVSTIFDSVTLDPAGGSPFRGGVIPGPVSGWSWVPRNSGTPHTRASPLPCLPPKPQLEPPDWMRFHRLQLGQARHRRWSPSHDGAVPGSASGLSWTVRVAYAYNWAFNCCS